ncbi:M48 family metallopeptidase [Nocardioides sp. cx-173]|uniref:M48 family metallopeptidase n=1 Tax=Nocardioides sp. cx-173 TaxID=2898796 RepID=UPI001E565BBB|nr:M48 family metallopeptidase [Nocardioides sp. cx-173]MCD4524942.1 M48 family metallopeptidase [Nocardioides sp. cx-173]UGB43441.1 M48 family metallopeptidase [Nocardioides sp. cx-173]
MTAEDPGAERRVALVTTLVGLVAFVALAAWLVPWDPVPGGRLEPADPLSVFTPEQVERAEAFSHHARILSWSSLAVSLAVACWLGLTRRGRALFGRLPGPWWVQVPLAVAVVDLLRRVVTLPFAVLLWRARVDEGLSTQDAAAFFSDLVKGELLDIAVTSLGLLAVLACARRWRRAWPAIAGAGLGVLVLAGSFVYPVVVEPLFNEFEPLPDGPLRSEIMRLADEEGVVVDDVLVADASRRTTTLNAYVSGFGGTRRVVVYDTLVDGLPQDQALSVVAHELAHARHGDVVTGSLLGAAGALVGVGLLALVLGRVRQRGGPGLADPAVVPLVLVLLALASLVSSPVSNTVSRQIETRADVDALRATDDPAAFIAMQTQLALRSLSDPTPPAWSQFWFGSHPTGLTRIALAQRLAND